jgi:hypothetical protein
MRSLLTNDYFELGDIDSHRGCTTPAQIGNLKEASDGDTDMVDGYDELPADLQEKVKTALEEGHVADEDWKGVSRGISPLSTAFSHFAGCRVQPPR